MTSLRSLFFIFSWGFSIRLHEHGMSILFENSKFHTCTAGEYTLSYGIFRGCFDLLDATQLHTSPSHVEFLCAAVSTPAAVTRCKS